MRVLYYKGAAVTIESPPCILRSIPNWVVWKLWNAPDRGKLKLPISPRNGKAAKTNDPQTWVTFQEAKSYYDRFHRRLSGLGFVLFNNGIFGIDLDGCFDGNQISPWAIKIMERFQTYTEISPSGTGIKLYGIGEVPTGLRLKVKVTQPDTVGKTPGIEVYSNARLFCYTGQSIGLHRELHECSKPLLSLLKKMQPPEKRCELKRNNIRGGSATVEHARNWLQKHGPAISGSFGHTHTYSAALALVDGFGLDDGTALELLREWNQTCQPPWSERDLVRKIQQAARR